MQQRRGTLTTVLADLSGRGPMARKAAQPQGLLAARLILLALLLLSLATWSALPAASSQAAHSSAHSSSDPSLLGAASRQLRQAPTPGMRSSGPQAPRHRDQGHLKALAAARRRHLAQSQATGQAVAVNLTLIESVDGEQRFQYVFPTAFDALAADEARVQVRPALRARMLRAAGWVAQWVVWAVAACAIGLACAAHSCGL
jgi:hypothetical protein